MTWLVCVTPGALADQGRVDGLAAGLTATHDDEPRHRDPAIRRALALLADAIEAPIEVIDLHTLPPALRARIGNACSFIRVAIRRIYISQACPAYLNTEGSRLDAMKLAALIRHEWAHVQGADERLARDIESRTFRALLAQAPAECQTPGIVYAAAIDRVARRSPSGVTSRHPGTQETQVAGTPPR